MEFQLKKKNPRRQSPQGKLLFFLFFFKHLTEIITGMFHLAKYANDVINGAI
jgi:hypothetical protein